MIKSAEYDIFVDMAALNLWQHIASRLQEDIGQSDTGSLPPVSELCVRYRVSHPTVLKALHFLRDQGIVELSRGRRASVRSKRKTEVLKESPGSVVSICGVLADRIGRGMYRSGMLLPKVAVFAAEERVSQKTVCSALRLLAARNMIRKKGRQWVVGGEPGITAMSARTRPVREILILQPRPRMWSDLLTNRTLRFVETFETEAHSHGVKLSPCLLSNTKNSREIFPAGTDEVAAKISELGERYAGCVSVVRSASDVVALQALSGCLAQAGAPVVVLAQNPTAQSRALDMAPFTTCRFSETVFSRAALDYVFSMGHRRIIYVGGFEGPGWQLERLALLRDSIRLWYPAAQIISYHDATAHLKSLGRHGIESRLSSIVRQGPSYARKALQYVTTGLQPGLSLNELASWLMQVVDGGTLPCSNDQGIGRLLPMLFTGDISCWIASRDFMAQSVLKNFVTIGLQLPHDFSMISYDNYLNGSELPVTTIDNGAGYLGYRAFHAILRDIPVHQEPDGSLVAEPQLIDRGTVAHADGGED